MRFQSYLTEADIISSFISKIKGFSPQRLQDFLYKEFERFVEVVETSKMEPVVVQIINKHFDMRIRDLDELKRMRVPQMREGTELNEDLAHWWDAIKAEAFPTLAFYPALQVWLEIDKLLKGQDMNFRATIVYALFWVLLISGKYIKGWLEWKKQNPDEYNREKMARS